MGKYYRVHEKLLNTQKASLAPATGTDQHVNEVVVAPATATVSSFDVLANIDSQKCQHIAHYSVGRKDEDDLWKIARLYGEDDLRADSTTPGNEGHYCIRSLEGKISHPHLIQKSKGTDSQWK